MEIDAKRYFKLSLPGRSKTAENELRWLLIAASAYAQAINAASFREGKNVLGTGGISHRDQPATRDRDSAGS